MTMGSTDFGGGEVSPERLADDARVLAVRAKPSEFVSDPDREVGSGLVYAMPLPSV